MTTEQQILELNKTDLTLSLGTGTLEPLKYNIHMLNNYLTKKGSIYKTQSLHSTYMRSTIEEDKDIYMLNDFLFDSVIFTSNKTISPMHWNFAEKFYFPFYLITRDPSKKAIITELNLHQKLQKRVTDFRNALSKFPKLPSAYLFIMQIYDIISFEIFSYVVTEHKWSSNDIGNKIPIQSISNSEFDLSLGLYSEDSTFKNGQFTITFIGYTLAYGEPCAIFIYECLGSEVTMADDVINIRRTGLSTYSGHILISTSNCSVVAGTMHENYTGIQNLKNIHITRDIILNKMTEGK